MFEISVTDLEQARYLVDSGWPTHIISVLMQDVSFAGKRHLHVKFDDVDQNTALGLSNEDWQSETIIPQKAHLITILKFTEDLTDDDKLLVHCLRGKGRSTAVAIAVLIQHNIAYDDAYNQIALVSPKLTPNKLIIKYTDEHFGLKGNLVRFVADRELFPGLFKIAQQ